MAFVGVFVIIIYIKKEKEKERRMMRDGSKRKSSLDCDVGLGLKMQLEVQPPTESHSYDGPIFGGSDMYEASYARNFRNTALGVAAGGGGGGMAVSGKGVFTVSQWEELERQSLIHKYIMASIPVPPQLLSQSNNSGLELKYSSSLSSGSDPEPWRCKRTDGKKWRCSRDVAPDHKYCERHAHKSRPRSRKHVEIQSHISNNNSNSSTQHPLQSPTSQFPTMASTTSYHDYDQTRCMEWFMRGGSSVTTCNQQPWQHQLTQTTSSSSSRLNRDNSDHNIKNLYEDKLHAFMGIGGFNIPYIPEQKFETLSTLNSKIASLQNGNADGTQTTRHFIDAWGKESTSTLTKRFSPSSSLTLSMNGIDRNDDDESGYLGIGTRDNEGIMKFGGPLGEALCLGNNATTTRGNSNLASSPADHGYGNTNSSSCSKSSCEDGNHAFNFIG
ncbi:hypothetical protein BUALT_Bualt05G0091600 [Buddleja alternifolia]|uniref:Growth-regulating factor n=1 Tax=Buddleja alternifolia TaxID=168488 RepID=A0AAV6XPM0_9LAMI|nr:hypothetical protein BUALT_Bualt05G0091600 [Buddleja alternifolia]